MNRMQAIYDWIEKEKPKVILEVGTWNGLNALHMIKAAGQGFHPKYIGFDIWDEGDETLDELEYNAKKRVTEESVATALKDFEFELVKGNTRQTLAEYVKGKDKFVDMAFIDGGHSKGTIKSDMLNVIKVMKPSGTIFMDDYYFGCKTPNVGAQTVMATVNFPYTVLTKVDKANDGSLIKLVKINVRDIPSTSWDMKEEESWSFNPEAA